jgi:hypothetical protein
MTRTREQGRRTRATWRPNCRMRLLLREGDRDPGALPAPALDRSGVRIANAWHTPSVLCVLAHVCGETGGRRVGEAPLGSRFGFSALDRFDQRTTCTRSADRADPRRGAIGGGVARCAQTTAARIGATAPVRTTHTCDTATIRRLEGRHRSRRTCRASTLAGV